MAQPGFNSGDYVDFGTTESTTTASAVLDGSLLTNAVIGDLIVVLIHDQTGSATATTAPSTDWVRVGGAVDATNIRQTGMYYYLCDSDAKTLGLKAGSFTWTFASGGRISCVAKRYTGVDLASPVNVAAAAFTNATGATTLAVGSVTTTQANTLLVCVGQRQNSAVSPVRTLTSIGSMTVHERVTSVSTAISTTSGFMGYEELTSSGATGTRTITFSGSTSTLAGELVAFNMGSWTPPNPGKPVKFTSATDTLATGKLYYTSATDTLTTPGEVRPVPTGYSSVTAMLATTPPFYLSHRGGELSWPEASLYAYTQSVFWGVGALEVSLDRTSDAVWVATPEDGSIDTTSGTTGFTVASNTYATLMTHQIDTGIPSGQTAKPYMRLDELISAYASTHVIFVDPKSAASHHSELLAIMAAVPSSTSRFVAKSYGVGTAAGWVAAARAAGYKTWGYYYDADIVAGSDVTYQGNFDILGLNYNATAPHWTTILSYGKPVIGHICATSANVSTAVANGASGVVVSNITAAVPRST